MNAKLEVASKYRHQIAETNQRVGDFNGFLAKEHQLKFIDPNDPDTFAVIGSPTWVSEPLPCNHCAGIYILGAHDEKISSRPGAYVRRASLKSIRYGIRSILNSYKATNPCAIQIGSSTFWFEVILVVPIFSGHMRSMACALEEHIIKYGLESVYLFNGPDTLPDV